MHSNNKYDGINPDVISIVRRKVHQLIKHQYFSKDEFQDLEQELVIEFLNKRINYNPNKSSLTTYATKIIRDKAINLITHRSCQKNDYKISIRSLYEPILSNDNKEEICLLIDTIPSNTTFCDYDCPDSIEQMELELDIEQLVNKIPTDFAQLYEDLQSMSISEIAKIRKKSRTTIHKRIKILKKFLYDL